MYPEMLLRIDLIVKKSEYIINSRLDKPQNGSRAFTDRDRTGDWRARQSELDKISMMGVILADNREKRGTANETASNQYGSIPASGTASEYGWDNYTHFSDGGVSCNDD